MPEEHFDEVLGLLGLTVSVQTISKYLKIHKNGAPAHCAGAPWARCVCQETWWAALENSAKRIKPCLVLQQTCMVLKSPLTLFFNACNFVYFGEVVQRIHNMRQLKNKVV